MKKLANTLAPLCFGLYFMFLFYKQNVGLNLVLFEVPLALFLISSGRLNSLSNLGKLVGGLLLYSTFLVVYRNTGLALFFHHCLFLLFISFVAMPKQKVLNFAPYVTLINVFTSIWDYWSNFINEFKRFKFTFILIKWLKLGVIPLIVLWLFASMYRQANPWFNELSGSFLDALNNCVNAFFEQLDALGIFLTLFGLTLSVWFIYAKSNEYVEKRLIEFSEQKQRVHNKYFSGKTTALSNEYKLGILLFAGLNLLLLIVNLLDVYWVWFNFEWTGQFLKQFVHEGTYLLLFSVLISVGLVFYFFKGNQHFYKKSKLRLLTVVWLIQNGFLVLSVAIRNYYYIEHFALAFKRIGVYFFLAWVVVLLVTVVVFVKKQKSFQYIVKQTSLSGLILFTVLATPHWSKVIARYNFNHIETAFLHYDFLIQLDDAALPMLYKTPEELQVIERAQSKVFRFDIKYMNDSTYHEIISSRIHDYLQEQNNESWVSWNYADYKLRKELETL